MEENDGNTVRIRLVFDDRHLLDKSQRSQGLRRCWFLLKPDIKNIGDLASQIRECFGLRHRIVLFMDDFVLPSFESTCIITDKDIIRVKKKETIQKDICEPCDGQILLEDSENARVHDLALNNNVLVDGKSQEYSQGNGSYDKDILTSCMENSVYVDPIGDVGLTKRKRKHSKKLVDSKGLYDEINRENDFEPSNNSDVRKKKQLRPQIAPHTSDGEEYDVAAAVQPGRISFQPRVILDAEHGSQQADETEKPLFFDGESSIKEQDRNKEKSFLQTTDNNQFFKVNVAPVSDGILPLPKPQVMSPAIDIAKPCKHINFATLIPLCRLPVKGDILAYRFMGPSSSDHPQLSSPQVGEVSSFDCKTLHIILLPVLDHVLVSDENSHGAIVQPNASRYKEDGSLEIEFFSLVDVRLVKAHGWEEEKAYQDNHARKDKWEEALVKGSWNEPNASTGEQNNSWSQWIPNKSAAAMSCSLNQSNAPFAGRGRGRGRRAPNRCMSNRNPNISTVSWNFNRNNAAGNPNMSNARFTAFDDNVMPPWPYGAPGLPIPWEHHQNNNFLPASKFSGRGKQ